MTKEELLEKLKYTYDLWEEVNFLRNQNNWLSGDKYDDYIGLLYKVTAALGYIGYIIWYVNDVTRSIFEALFLGIPVGMIRGLVVIILLGVFWVVTLCVLKIIACKKNKKEIENNNFKINNIIKKIHETSVVPAKYLNKNFIGRFIEYIENIRADNLKECINLLEQEVSNEERIRIMKESKKILLENQELLRNIESNTAGDLFD